MLDRAGIGYHRAAALLLPRGTPTQLDREDLGWEGCGQRRLEWVLKEREKTALPQNGRILEKEMTEKGRWE